MTKESIKGTKKSDVYCFLININKLVGDNILYRESRYLIPY